VFENRVLRRIFGAKREEVTEEWRKLHNEELNLLKPSIYIMYCEHHIRYKLCGRKGDPMHIQI
jgi:hypothetical protein